VTDTCTVVKLNIFHYLWEHMCWSYHHIISYQPYDCSIVVLFLATLNYIAISAICGIISLIYQTQSCDALAAQYTSIHRSKLIGY